MYPRAFRSRLCAVFLIIALLTLKASVVLTARQQMPSDLRPTVFVSVSGAMREANDGVHFRFNRALSQTALFKVFFPQGQNWTEFAQPKDLLSAMLVLRAAIPVFNLAADGDVFPPFPPNTVSRK